MRPLAPHRKRHANQIINLRSGGTERGTGSNLLGVSRLTGGSEEDECCGPQA